MLFSRHDNYSTHKLTQLGGGHLDFHVVGFGHIIMPPGCFYTGLTMAGYLKLWTTLRTNRTFLSLKLNARGLYIQLLLICKDQRDDGQVWYKNAAEMSQSCGCDPRTLVKLLQALSINAVEMLIEYNINADGTVVVNIPNYIEWQQLDAKTVQQKSSRAPTKLQPLRPDQTKAKQTIPSPPEKTVADPVDNSKAEHSELVTWWCEAFKERSGVSYHFKSGKDGKSLRMIIKHCTAEHAKAILQMVLNTKTVSCWDLSLIYMRINEYGPEYNKSLQKQDESWMK